MITPASNYHGCRNLKFKIHFGLVVLLFCVQSSLFAQPAIFLSTPSGTDVAGAVTYNPSYPVHYDCAVAFTAPNLDYSVSEISLYLNSYEPNLGITGHISFYDVDTATWLSTVYYGPANVDPGAYVWVNFLPTGGSGVELRANTSYMMDVTADGSPGFNWMGNAYPPAPTPSGVAQYTAFYDYGVGVSQNPQNPQAYYVMPSFTIFAVPVPEPNSVWLLGIALIAVRRVLPIASSK